MLKFLILAALAGAALATNSYVVISPKSFRPGLPLSVSIDILKSTAPVAVTINLKNKLNNRSVATASGSFNQGVPGTLQLTVPDSLHSGAYKLHVEGRGHGIHFTNETDIAFKSKSMSIFIQTDKAMYKPGQTVHFRAFGMYPNMTVYTGPMDIAIFDPNMNEIKQWRGVKDVSGVVTNYMIMDTQPVLGDWKIKVMAHGRNTEKVVTVAHYVLPKFEVTVELPSYALSDDATVTGKIKAKYTYGKPVNGSVEFRARLDHWYRPYHYTGSEPMVTQSLQIDGEASFSIPLSHFHNIQHMSLSGRSLIVEANVTESLNQITLNGSSKVQFYTYPIKIEIIPSSPKTFKPELQYIAYARVSQQDGSPVSEMSQSRYCTHTTSSQCVSSPLMVTVNTTVTYELPGVTPTPYTWYQPPTRTYQLAQLSYSVPASGIIPIEVDIPANATHISLNVAAGSNLARVYQNVDKSYSPSGNYMQLLLKSTQLKAGQRAAFEVKGTETITHGVYQVMSRGSVVSTGSFSGRRFSVPITAKMAPNARIIAYYVRMDGEVVTDSISFDVEGAFLNKVSIDFDKKKAEPGDSVHVVVGADPQSVVNLLAVDQSVLLLKSGNDISASQVVDELKSYDTISHPSYSRGGGFCCHFFWNPYPIYYGGSDAQQIFDNAGVKVMTDVVVYHHYTTHRYHHWMTDGVFEKGPQPPGAMGGGIPPMRGNGGGTQQSLQEPSRVRTVFPETWLWSNSSTGANGKVTITTTVPDTITSWIASAFAVNGQSGLGVAPSKAKIETFKQFFVSLNLPYSVVRGEEVALQANVFNYMIQDVDVLVTLAQSAGFRNIVLDAHGITQFVSQQQTARITIAAGAAKSVFFPIVPAALGDIDITVKAQTTISADAVTRKLLVEPEGVAKEYSNPILIDLKHTSSFTKNVTLSLPAGVVAGSQRVVVTAIGDLMGPTVNGLDKLLRMPTGCGEQTMLGFAPDVFVTNYLTATNQLTGDVEEKALNYMEKGYQRELTYQHKDGSFSAFGDRDPSGSMWLTAFVIKSFHQAKTQIFIDDAMIKKAITWMLSHQSSDGSFPEPGRVIHKDMQGGSASGPGLTAFVLIALLENDDIGGSFQQTINHAASRAQSYLETRYATVTDDYVLAIASYALTLANSSVADAVIAKLDADAIARDGMKHWHKAQTSTSSHHYWQPSHRQSNPIDIEMTAYVLLINAIKNDFPGGMPIMKWLTTQRNSNGGFSSTQDTVIGLQALGDFAKMVYSNNFDVHATITAGTFTHHFNINQGNALVLQSVVLPSVPSVPSQVVVAATGHGMALVDVSLFFHVEQEIEETSFDVQVTMVTETTELLSIKTCTKWLKTGASGMAVQEFGIPTGFEADLESISMVTEIMRTETQNRKVVLYFNEISTTPICLTLDIVRTGMVAKSQPAAIRVYDYYQPSNQITKFYQSHVLKNSGICSMCTECGCHAASNP